MRVYVALAYDKNLSVENHLRARESLERAVELDPEYALAWGYLSWIYTDEYIYGFNPLPDSMPRALRSRSSRRRPRPEESHQRVGCWPASTSSAKNTVSSS